MNILEWKGSLVFYDNRTQNDSRKKVFSTKHHVRFHLIEKMASTEEVAI